MAASGDDAIYRDLQEHLDRQSIGFPATPSGAEIRLLRHLFTPAEARIALHVTHKPAPAERIHAAAPESGISDEAVRDLLEGMAKKGAIGRLERDGAARYYAMPLVVGMYEGQVNRLTPEFLQDIGEYTSDEAFGRSFLGTGLPQMRTIPVGKSIAVEHRVATYDQILGLLDGSGGPFAILECICRKAAEMQGSPCAVTSRRETCMALGDMAGSVIHNGSGREISRDEAVAIIRLNEEDGLVFQPSNTRKVEFVCSCCGCCCGMLRVHKMLPRPVDFWASNFHVAIDAESCAACGECADRCQVGALALPDPDAAPIVDLGRCIGCGHCVVSCPSGALSLVKKEAEVVPPADWQALHETLMAHKKGSPGKPSS